MCTSFADFCDDVGTWLDRASVLYNEWLRVKRGAQAASSAKEAAMRRLQPSLSIAVEAGYAAAANAANRQDGTLFMCKLSLYFTGRTC